VAEPVKKPDEVRDVDGLVIPGGESTTIGKLACKFGVDEALYSLAARKAPIWGTCAGMILLAREIEESDQWRLGLMDLTVRRNAFGRQVDSFETDLPFTGIAGDPVRAVFIRAPYVTAVGDNVQVLARHEDKIVAARQDHLLATAFHPELTGDHRVQQYFCQMVAESD
jgi:5'-phosphate synthase pdxT subunit